MRWIQQNSSGTCCDNWGVDNINVYSAMPGMTYLWNTGDTTLDLTVAGTVDSLYTVEVYDSTNTLLCTDSVYLEMSSASFDLGIQAVSQTIVQQGQLGAILFDAYNMGCPDQSGEIVIKLDSLLSFVSSNPVPASVTSDSIVYNYSSLYENGPHFIINMNVLTSQSAVTGDLTHVDAYITPITGDANPLDNTKNYIFPVLASYDPNDKRVYPVGDCDIGYVPNDQLMTYTIRFQNTGTANAINVRLRDEIDPNLDPSTLRVVASSDNFYLDWVTPTTLDFKFDDIQLPPQSQGDFESMGYIVFEIEQTQGLPHGTAFTNQVDIYFDYNPPITTNQVLNTVTDGSHAPVGDTLFVNEISSYDWNGQTYTSSGVYVQTFPQPDGCDSTAILSLTLESDVSLDELKDSPLVMYPNPAKDHLVVKGKQNGILRFLNPAGAIVLEEKITGDALVRFEHLSSGVYLVEIESEGKLYREKLIIQK